MTCEEIALKVEEAVSFVCENGHVQNGSLVVIGCSTSEIGGGHIGKAASPETGYAVVRGALNAARKHQVYLAFQCCEHLNRCLVVEKEYALSHFLPPVAAVPYPHAGGSTASAAYRTLENPVLVEHVQAQAGVDIGDTLIGMHLQSVAVPLRAPFSSIGQAHLTMAFTRPKYIGGARAKYSLED